MTDPHLDHLAAAIDETDVPAGRGLDGIRQRAHQRMARRRAVGGVAVVALFAVAAVGSGLLVQDDPELTTAAPATIERFDQVPDGIGTWEFRATPAIVSRTGQASGFGLRQVTGSDDLLIYLTDGGVCVDVRSCATAVDSFDGADLEAQFVATDGGPLRSLVGAGAPFAGWNVAVVPGINGDFHAGSRDEAGVPGVAADQQMVGAENLDLVLAAVFDDDVVAHDRVVVAGSGSAGLGVLLTIAEVEETVGSALAAVVVDGAAIPRAPGQLPSCVVQRWGQLIGLGFPDDWDERVGPDDTASLSGIYSYVAGLLPDVEFVLVTDRIDPAMRRLYGSGAGGCDPLPEPTIAGFARGVVALEAHLDGLAGWTPVVVDGSGSTPIARSADLTDLGDLDAVLRSIAEGT